MKNYFIVGHSSGIGKALTELLSADNKIFGTYYKSNFDFQNPNVSSHYLNVLDEKYDLNFLPDSIDGLVYCPGSINLKPFERIKETEFIDDYKLQVLGAIKIIQYIIPKLKKGNYPSIVLFSTVAVQTGFKFHSIVSLSKGAIEGLTKSLAAEYAPKIRVNCIAPSLTDTPLASGFINTEEKLIQNSERHPMKSIGAAEDIASLAAFLLSEKSKFITGRIFHIDGGIGVLK